MSSSRTVSYFVFNEMCLVNIKLMYYPKAIQTLVVTVCLVNNHKKTANVFLAQPKWGGGGVAGLGKCKLEGKNVQIGN